MGLLDGRRGIVFGVANERSIAWHIAGSLVSEGAVCGFSYLPGEKNERRVRQTVERGGISNPWLYPCDVGKDEDIAAVFEAAKREYGTISFIVHSVAFADKEYMRIGRFVETPRQVFTQALDISAYTLISMANAARPMMPDGGSILALSYYGGEKVIPGYNIMGVAKAALEASARYLAADLGRYKIRVNTISAGLCRTLSSMAVANIEDMSEWVQRKSPLQRNIETDEVGKSAVYLISDLSSGVTGENLHVDSGFNIIGL